MALQTDTATAVQVEAAQRLQTAAQTATQIEIAPGLRTVVQPETARALSAQAQIEVVPGPRNVPLVRPELAPDTRSTLGGRPWTIDLPGTGTNTPGQPETVPWEIDVSDPKDTGKLQPFDLDIPGPRDLTAQQSFTLPELGTAPAPFGKTNLEAAPSAEPDTRERVPDDDITTGDGITDEDLRLDGSITRVLKPDPEARRGLQARKVQQPIPDGAHPGRGESTPAGGRVPPPRGSRGGGLGRRPRRRKRRPRFSSTWAIPRSPRRIPPHHRQANTSPATSASWPAARRSPARRSTPCFLPRDAAEQHPEGQVEEAVFVTDLDTSETTVHRYRDKREAGESLEDQLERLSDEDRQVVPASAGAEEESRPDKTSNLERAQSILAAAGTGASTAAHTAAQHAGSLLGRGRAMVQAGRGHAGTSLERGRAIAQAANNYVDEHAPETKAALLERARQLTGGNQGGQRQPAKSLDKSLADLIRGQAAQSGAQKNAPKTARRRSSSRITDKDLRKAGRRGKVIIIRE